MTTSVRDLAAAHPLVGPLAALLIDALYRDGRAAEALDRYAKVRHLVDELGTEPGIVLRELHGAILRGERPQQTAPATRATLPADTVGSSILYGQARAYKIPRYV